MIVKKLQGKKGPVLVRLLFVMEQTVLRQSKCRCKCKCKENNLCPLILFSTRMSMVPAEKSDSRISRTRDKTPHSPTGVFDRPEYDQELIRAGFGGI
jgi:hypothetical protein